MPNLIGSFTLGQDAQKKEGQNGEFLSLSLAYDYYDGERKTQWIRATFGGTRALNMAEHLTKGTKIEATIKDLHIATFEGGQGTQHSLEGRVIDANFINARKQDGGTTSPD